MPIAKKWIFEYEIIGNKKLRGQAILNLLGLGKCIVECQDEEYQFFMLGKFNGRNFFGEWLNLYPHDEYVGTFHLILSEDGKFMEGVFTGNTRGNTISTGTWKMEAIE